MEARETIITKTYATILYALAVLEKYPRSQKFLLADRIETMLLNILEKLLEAYYSGKEVKLVLLESINIDLEKLRYLFRLSYDIKCINIEKYDKLTEMINEIGKISGGWRKSLT